MDISEAVFEVKQTAIHVLSIMPFMQQNMRRNGSDIFCKLKATVRPALYEFSFFLNLVGRNSQMKCAIYRTF
jgi:hypothetical protein